MKKAMFIIITSIVLTLNVSVLGADKTSYKETKNGKIVLTGGVINEHNGKIPLNTMNKTSEPEIATPLKGETIVLSGITFTALNDNGTLYAKVSPMLYSTNNSNNWTNSDLRKYLNETLLNSLDSSMLTPMTTNIVNTVDGTSTEVSTDMVRLMTVNEAVPMGFDYWLIDHYYSHTGQKQMCSDGRVRNSYGYDVEKGVVIVIQLK